MQLDLFKYEYIYLLFYQDDFYLQIILTEIFPEGYKNTEQKKVLSKILMMVHTRELNKLLFNTN